MTGLSVLPHVLASGRRGRRDQRNLNRDLHVPPHVLTAQLADLPGRAVLKVDAHLRRSRGRSLTLTVRRSSPTQNRVARLLLKA